MKKILLALLGFVFATHANAQYTKVKNIPALLSNEISSPVEFREQPFDVLHYDAYMDLTKAPAREMSGRCMIKFVWKNFSDGDKFFFHLRSLKIDSAYYNLKQISPVETGTPALATYHFEVTPPIPQKSGDTAYVTIYYSGAMTAEPGSYQWGGVSNDGPLYAMGVGIFNNYVSSTQHWLPCYDHPSDKATFRVKFRVKSDKVAASNGTLIVLPDTDSTRIFEWTEKFPAATYLLTFAVGNYAELPIKGMSVPGVIYPFRSDSADATISFSKLPQMVAMLEKNFGSFPYEKVGYVSTQKGAMEHQSMISINTSIIREKNPENVIAVHELTHQWFGDLVTPKDFRHAWLSESFATYGESLWQQELKGDSGYVTDQEDKINRYFTSAKSEGIFPMYDFKRTPPSNNYPETIYKKGAVVLGMLRYELGDSLFFGALKNYLVKYKYGNVTSAEFISAVEEFSGRDLKQFFDQWVYGKGWPELTVKIDPVVESGVLQKYEVTLRQVQDSQNGIYKNLPVALTYTNSDSITLYKVVRMNSVEEKFILDDVWPDPVRINKHPNFRTLMKIVSVTDVDEEKKLSPEKKIEIIPNPASGETKIFFSPSEKNSTLEILDILGRKIFSAEIPAYEQNLHFSAGNFPSGTYLLRIGEQFTQLHIVK